MSDTTTAEAPEADPAEATNSGPGREAAKYRVRAREAEQERDALTQRVEQLQTREVERLASKHLSAPADLLTLGGVSLADLLDDNGDVDPEKVNAVATEVLGARPGLKPLDIAHDPSQGTGGNPGKRAPDWGSLFKD